MNRIKRLFEILSPYSFNLYYIKGKDMILGDFLSRQIEDDSNLHEIIPISFNIREVLQENYHNITRATYMMQTRSQTKAQVNAPTVSDTQVVAPKTAEIPIKMGKGKESEILPNRTIQQPPKGIGLPQAALIPTFVMPPNGSPPPKPPHVDPTPLSPSLGPDPNVDYEENSPHQEGITSKVVQKYLP